jgi:hypothetical protein
MGEVEEMLREIKATTESILTDNETRADIKDLQARMLEVQKSVRPRWWGIGLFFLLFAVNVALLLLAIGFATHILG